MHECSGKAEDLLVTECGGRWRWVGPARQVHAFPLKQVPSGCHGPSSEASWLRRGAGAGEDEKASVDMLVWFSAYYDARGAGFQHGVACLSAQAYQLFDFKEGRGGDVRVRKEQVPGWTHVAAIVSATKTPPHVQCTSARPVSVVRGAKSPCQRSLQGPTRLKRWHHSRSVCFQAPIWSNGRVSVKMARASRLSGGGRC